PVALLGPHTAALGMRFYTGRMFPAAYRNAIFIARHGSWNKTNKLGGDVIVVKLNPNGSVKSWEPFMTGFLQDNNYTAARWTWRCSRTARCWCRTTTPARSTASAMTAAASPNAERISPAFRPPRVHTESRLRAAGKMLDTATEETSSTHGPRWKKARRRISFPHREDHHALLVPPARLRARRNARYATRCCGPGDRPAANSAAARLPVNRPTGDR